MKVYVGCSLRKAPEALITQVEKFKSSLNDLDDVEVLKFVGLGDYQDTDVFSHDIYSVESCDIFVAICDEPSTGLGIEIERAMSLRKPILLPAHQDAEVSKMISGYAKLQANMTYETYQELATDGLETVRDFIA